MRMYMSVSGSGRVDNWRPINCLNLAGAKRICSRDMGRRAYHGEKICLGEETLPGYVDTVWERIFPDGKWTKV